MFKGPPIRREEWDQEGFTEEFWKINLGRCLPIEDKQTHSHALALPLVLVTPPPCILSPRQERVGAMDSGGHVI